MGQLRRSVILIAACLAFTSPGAAKIIKFEILKIESPASEGRSFVRDRLMPEEDARLSTASSN